ncbi:TolC family outer membrane protein [Yoonia litorea]|uniref:Outer membrane protein n=1 Tax=Yoonia litorea TaxID=1123755 RepID=A0A1I6N249_9RHOB|nr:TolC family outer membrane protein [Yoonia litorea]SFS22045.1 outer membrane protein [Yoonia litorea]
MFGRKGLAITAAIVAMATAPAANAQSLSEALASAYNSSGLLEQNRALLRAADEGVAQSVAATLPVINWSASATRTRVTTPIESTTNAANARISGSVTIYDGGANDLAIEAQKEIVLATRQSLRGVEQSVLLRAVQAYANVLSARNFVQLRENNVRLIIQEFRAAQDRFEVGEVTRTDVSLAEARLASARSLLAAAQGDLAVAAQEFNAVVGQMPTSPRAVSPAPVSRSLREAQALAVRNHPSILEAQHSVAAAELNIRRAEAATLPRATLDAFISIDQDGYETGQLGVNVGGPIYSGGLLSSQIRQIRANRDAARAGLLVAVEAIEQQVANAFAQVQVARASREASEQQIRAAQVAFDGVREEAQLGSRTTLDVLNAEQELLDARANRIAAQANEVVASYGLLASMGLLTADHLNLPVQQYDPSAYYNLVKTAPVAISEQGRALERVLEAIGQD